MNPTGRLARIFRQAGFDLYLVGGPVRDRIIGRPSHDLDFTTAARPDRVKVLARRAGATSIYTVGERFGTIGAVFESGPVEITTFRAESYRQGSRKPEVQFGDSLEADLSRRDFTINAMAQDVLSGRIIDPHGGLADLVAGRVRAVGVADDRFREDPLRVLRCVRFGAQLEFDIEVGTLAAARRTAGELRHVSAERIGAELNLTLLSPEPGRALVTLLEIGVLGLVMPELIPLQQTEQEERRQHKDVFAHTMRVLSTTLAEPEIRWSALLHDVGKPKTKSIRTGRIRFFGHEEVGARMAAKIMRRLKFDGRLTDRVTHIVRLHMRANAYEPDWTDGAVRRFILEAGEDLNALTALSRADITSYRPRRIEAGLARVAELEARCEQLQAESDVAALRSPLDGHALIELFDQLEASWTKPVQESLLDLARIADPRGNPNAWLRPVLQHLLDLVLEGDLAPNDVERASELAISFVRRHAEAADALQLVSTHSLSQDR